MGFVAADDDNQRRVDLVSASGSVFSALNLDTDPDPDAVSF
jgi:hypothetical protein